MSLTTWTSDTPVSIAAETTLYTWTNTTGRDVLALVCARSWGLSATTSKPAWTLRHLTAGDVVIGDPIYFAQPRSAVGDGSGYRSESRSMGLVLVLAGEKLAVLAQGLPGDTTTSHRIDIIDAQETTAVTQSLPIAYDAAKSAAQAGDAMALTSAERQQISHIVHGADYIFVGHSGTDAASGAALLAAIAGATDKVIMIGSGTYDIGDNWFALTRCTVRGAGRGSTIITGNCTSGDMLLVLWQSRLFDVSVINTSSGSQGGVQVGWGSSLTRCYARGHFDGITVWDSSQDGDLVVLDDVVAVSAVDALALDYTGNGRVLGRCCNLLTEDDGTQANGSHGLAVWSGYVEITDSHIDAANVNNAYAGQGARCNAGSLILDGCDVRGLDADIVNAGGAVIAINTAYDPAKTTGAITIADTPGNVTGDVLGRVLGGGASAITGVGVRADDRDGAAIATASSVAAIPTAPLLAANYIAPNNAGIAAAAASAASADGKLTTARLALIDGARQQAQAAADKAALLAAIQLPGAGDGDTIVNHDSEADDGGDLRAVDGNEAGLDSVTIRAYVKSEYTANAATAVCRASAVTGSDGKWVRPMMLNAGITYVLVYSRSDLNTVTKEVTP